MSDSSFCSLIRVELAKQDPRQCPKCGTPLKSRGEKLLGRYYCPECPEGDGEYVITNEFYRSLLRS